MFIMLATKDLKTLSCLSGYFFCNWQQKNASAITKFLYVYLVTRPIRRHRKLFSLCASRICLPVLQILWLERVYFFVLKHSLECRIDYFVIMTKKHSSMRNFKKRLEEARNITDVNRNFLENFKIVIKSNKKSVTFKNHFYCLFSAVKTSWIFAN